LFYTDGIPDIQSPSGKAWGERQFIKAILATNSGSPPVSESVAGMVSLFQDYRQKANLIDDITFFMAEISDGPHA
jgi:serine phosphatase RsbU (regulator of sigma subunit)